MARALGVSRGQMNLWYGLLVVSPHMEAALTLLSLRIGREFSSDSMGDGPPVRGGTSAVASSVPYTRASIFVGLPSAALASRVDEVLDHRLADSSRQSIDAALGHWRVVTARHRWSEVIPSDDPSRGGKLATFCLYLLDETELAGSSIMNYLWALRAYMKLNRQLDPVFGLIEWEDWTQSVQVMAWCPSEPRRMVPLDLLRRALAAADVTDFRSVQTVVAVLMLLFTFARSETPCPKTLGGFDKDQHLQVCDVRVAGGGVSTSPFVAQWRLKRIKQDQRVERPEAAGNEDWLQTADTPEDLYFSLRIWMSRLFSLHQGAREEASPFFVNPNDRGQPLTYSQLMRDFRSMLEAVSSKSDAAMYGLHGLRVAGYALAKRGVGEELAVAHGGWRSLAHRRYDRFTAAEVARIPSAILSAAAALGSAGPPSVPLSVVTTLASAPVAAAPPQSLPAPPPRALPSTGGGRRAPLQRGASSSSTPVLSPAAPANVHPPVLPTDAAACVGRRVLVPRSTWPRCACREHGGTGWEAIVLSHRSNPRRGGGVEFKLRFTSPTSRGAVFDPVWLLRSVLQPLA